VKSRSQVLAAAIATACLVALFLAGFAQAAAPAWSVLASTAPTNLPPTQNEVQRIGVDAEGGTYTLTVRHVVATGFGITEINISVISGVSTDTGAFSVGQRIEGPAIAPGTTITAVGSGTLTISQPAANNSAGFGNSGPGTLVATDAVENTTAPVAFDAPAKESEGAGSVEAALNALPLVGAGGVSVGGGPGNRNSENPYLVNFGGGMEKTDMAPLLANSAGLSGGGTHNATVTTTVPGGPGTTTLHIYAQNTGGAASLGPVIFKVQLPTGVTTATTAKLTPGAACTPSDPGQEAFSCTTEQAVAPSLNLPTLNAPLRIGPGATLGTHTIHIEVEGGSAPNFPKVVRDIPLTVSALPTLPGAQDVFAGAYNNAGVPDQAAGAHPYSASAGVVLNTNRSPLGFVTPAGEFKDIIANLPPGFLGNPIAMPECSEDVVDAPFGPGCPAVTAAGITSPLVAVGGDPAPIPAPIFNMEAPNGYPARFKFSILGEETLNAVGSLRSDGDYGLSVSSLNTPQILPVYGFFFTFWGAPEDPAHDGQRCIRFVNGVGQGCVPGAENTAFLTNAVNCSEQAAVPPVTDVEFNTWQDHFTFFHNVIPIPPVTGCDKLKFQADFTFEPSETKADSPASFRTSLTVPSEGLTDPTKLTTPEIKDTVVTLPEGVVLNAAGADGLQACSLDQIGFKGRSFPMPNPIRFTKDAQSCPDASKIGTGELKTALLTDPLKGALYLAAQGEGNPYGSLFAIYLVIEDPRHGIFIKLPGRVDPDPQSGQMKVTFQNLPQLPFTRLDLNLKGGNRSALASPTTCGKYTTTATNTPWSAPESGPPTVSANGFEINQGPGGLPCANTPQERPFEIGWSAGAESVKAGASGPFNMRITRPDGSQELTGLSLKTPPGLSASLKGIPQCTAAQIAQAEASTGRAEQANSACPAASRVGTLTTGAGSGPSPFYVSGNLYLAGPYKGAPLSVVAITPAVAGPFDLGNVVVRNAVRIDRGTAQVSAQSDQIPQILKGVVLRIRDVRIKLDRSNWTINPTSCDASAVELNATGASGATASRSARFQVGGCSDLGFAPKLSAKVIGGTRRGAHPAFEANLAYPQGSYANIKDVQVALPHSEFLDQAHINTICTRPQAAANACPAGAIYGYAEATTPLLDGKLTGPVFLKSSVHKLPDLAIFLRGPDSQPIEVEFQGRIDSIKGQIRNTIEGLPDVPVSSFTLKMKGGKKGLLINSRDLCKGKPGRLTVKMVAQNNKSSETRPVLGNSCGSRKSGKAKKAKKSSAKRSRLAGLGAFW
jgi:hypothetical protein